MKRVVTRLASMAGVVVLTVGLPAMAGAAYGARQSHRPSALAPAPARAVARLDRLARTRLFPARRAAGDRASSTGWMCGRVTTAGRRVAAARPAARPSTR